MKFLDSLRFRIATLLQSSKIDAEMEEELCSHIQHRADDLERSGIPRSQAERRARIEFGSVVRYEEEVRDQRIDNWVRSVGSDCRYGVRQLRKNPGATAVMVLTLALGIGATTAIFSVVYGVLLRPLPYANSDRIMAVFEVNSKGTWSRLADPNFDDFRDQNHSFQAIAKY